MRNILFWFFNKKASLNLSKQADVDVYFHHAVTKGKTTDISQLLQVVNPVNLKTAFLHVANFLPLEVKRFWEDYFGNINSTANRTP